MASDKTAVVFYVLIWIVFLALMLMVARPKKPRSTPTERAPDVADIDQPADNDERTNWLDLKKLEYTQTSERYENIYRAIWQNFSYMAVLAGGILTFGSKELDHPTLVALALTPLVFWFLATFLPLDHYGDATRARVSQIEREINAISFPADKHPRLRHFISFRDSKFTWRVQDAVVWAGRIVIFAWTIAVVLSARYWINHLRNPPSTVTTHVVKAMDSLAVARRQLDSVDRMLQITLECLHDPPTRTRPTSC